ncbi:MAG: D-alanyl-D-alanine carboxypeptidase/D-alanyl-D-alanine-endopeptidase [Proteobacteria bacterium]|nr:D-alanyl-D-alanine carboxypeptidase/D-alanyl-D-alanine-endopeptidase [Pseudomonadota bacterium]
MHGRAWSVVPWKLARGSRVTAGLAIMTITLAVPPCAVAQRAPAVPPAVLQAIAAQRLPQSAVSFVVMDPDDSRIVAALNPAVPRSPASTVKVVTTFASLDMLGPVYTWHTRALLKGELESGTLKGDLVLQGGGDPYMTLERWWSFARALRNQGLQRIHGNIIIDDGSFHVTQTDRGAFDGKPNRNYNVLPDALMVNFQNVEFRLRANPATRRVEIDADPLPANLVIDNRVRYSTSRCRGPSRRVDYAVDPRDDRRVIFNGALSAECAPRSFGRVVMSPAEYAYGTFLAIWRELGGEFDGQLVPSATPADARPYLSFDSLSLAEIVRLTNKFSSNLMARHLLLTLGMERFGLPGTPGKGAQAIEEWSRQRGLPLADVELDNGSGLSRITRITVSELATVLNAAYHSRYAPEFLSSLPLAGLDGTLRRRLKETPAGAARLKTGHIDGVSGIAGYVNAGSGHTFVVVSLVNHPRADFGAGEPVHAALVDWVLGNL